MLNRKLLGKLSKCAWEVLSNYLKLSVPKADSTPGAVVAVHTFGDFLNFNPHIHILATDGCFHGDGAFIKSLAPEPSQLEEAFQHAVFKMLKAEGKITDAIIENMMGWYHTGFNVFCGDTIWPTDEKGLENLARYIIRACFSQERMTYIPIDASPDGQARVIYRSKTDGTAKNFNALDWLAQLVTHIPNKREHMVRYYGYYSNKSRGLRKKAGKDTITPALIDSDLPRKTFNRTWARLIQKIYEVDPLLCSNCQGSMRIIAFIENNGLIRKILKHIGLWETRNHGPPSPKTSGELYIPEITYDYSYSQIPSTDYWT